MVQRSGRGGRSWSSGVAGTGDRIGLETGLPLIWCPKCKMARVIELRVKRENENLGRVFIKCPRNVEGMPGMCPYYRWQREYFEELVKERLIVLLFDDWEEDDGEVDSKKVSEVGNSNLEAKFNQLVKTLQLLFVMVVVLVAVVVMYMFK